MTNSTSFAALVSTFAATADIELTLAALCAAYFAQGGKVDHETVKAKIDTYLKSATDIASEHVASTYSFTANVLALAASEFAQRVGIVSVGAKKGQVSYASLSELVDSVASAVVRSNPSILNTMGVKELTADVRSTLETGFLNNSNGPVFKKPGKGAGGLVPSDGVSHKAVVEHCQALVEAYKSLVEAEHKASEEDETVSAASDEPQTDSELAR